MDVKDQIKELDAKVDKALGVNVKPIHYAMMALILVSIVASLF